MRSTLTRDLPGRRLSCEVDEALRPLAEDLLNTVARLDVKGPPLAHGTSVQFGWSRLVIQAVGDTELWLREPNYAGDPLREVMPYVDATLVVLADQARLLKLAKVEPVETTYLQWLVIKRGVLAERRIYLERRRPLHDSDSGWFVGSIANRKDVTSADLDKRQVYQLWNERRAALQALTLPIGWMVILDGDRLESLVDASNRTVYPA